MRCLIVFAKEPRRYGIKTRLKNVLTAKQRCGLYKSFLQDVHCGIRHVRTDMRIVAYDAHGERPVYLQSIFRNFNFLKQSGVSLGQRMYRAFEHAYRSGASETVLIGSDIPTLPSAYVAKAFQFLAHKDAVIGPSYDGGYYLIGLKGYAREVFENIPWSTSDVFIRTRERLRFLKKSLGILPRWYDVDDASGLSFLMREAALKKSNRGFWTRKYLQQTGFVSIEKERNV